MAKTHQRSNLEIKKKDTPAAPVVVASGSKQSAAAVKLFKKEG